MRLKVYGGRGGQGLPKEAEFRPMTFQEAADLHSGDHIWVRADRGDARIVKVNGQPKRWKRTPSAIAIPFKYGMYEYGTLTERDLDNGTVLMPV